MCLFAVIFGWLVVLFVVGFRLFREEYFVEVAGGREDVRAWGFGGFFYFVSFKIEYVFFRL